VVLRRRQQSHAPSVAEPDHRDFLAWEELLDDHDLSGSAELALAEHVRNRGFSLLPGFGHDHAFARGQAGRLNDDRQTMLTQVVAGGIEVRESLEPRGRDTGRMHQFLGKGLVALDPRPALFGAEDLQALPFELVGRSGHQRRLRPDDRQVNLLPESKLGQAGQIRG